MEYIRKKLITLISIFKDFLIIYFLYNMNFYAVYNNKPNQSIVFCLITFWIVGNYVFGFYTSNNISKKTNSKIIGLFLVTIASNLIYLSINLITEGYEIDAKSLIFFISSTLQISFLIFITENIKRYIIFKNRNKSQSWVVRIDKEKFIILKKLLKNSNLQNISLTYLENEIHQLKNYKYNGIIIENNFLKKDEIPIITQEIKRGITVKNLLNWTSEFLQICPSEFLTDNDIIYLNNCDLSNSIQFRIKRLGDFFIGSILLLFLTPMMLLTSIIILLIDGNPIFYSQIRNGFKAINIKIFKFRSMVKGAEKNGPQWSKVNDQRITGLGKILRKYRIDELPQLISVIKGDMSLIGPRPERPLIENKLKEQILHYELRNLIKPGISGWAQVNYPYGASILDSKNKLNYDLYYIKNYSIFIDIVILFKTLKIVLNGKGYKPKN